MSADYNQTSENLYNRYRAENVGISYTGLIYNLDVRDEISNLYSPAKNKIVELSSNYQNKNFLFSTPGAGLLATNGIGTDSITFTGIGTDFATNDITVNIPGIGTDTPSKLTVEMWVKINDIWGYYAGAEPNGNGGMPFSFDCYDVYVNPIGVLGFNAFDTRVVGITSTMTKSLKYEGNWTHFAFVMTPYVSNAEIHVENKIYINSYDQGTLYFPDGNPNARSFAGGNFKINGNSCGGYSDDYKLNMNVGAVRVYNRELTSEEVIQNYNTTKGSYFTQQIVSDGLVLNLDATNSSSVGVGTTWTDLSGNGNNGTLVNGPYHSDGPFLDAGFVSFDGTDDYLSVGSTTDFNIGTSDFTMEGWFLISDNSSTNNQGNRNAALFANYPASGTITGYSIIILGDISYTGTGLVFENWNSGATEKIDNTVSISQNEWHHVAACRSGTTTRVFLDGTEVASGTFSNQSVTSPNDMKIGAALYDGFQHYLNGQISNFRIINGTALYTSNFTPPSRLLTAVDNTVLLTCQKETIRDGSIGIHTVTANNGPVANLGFPSSSYEFDGTDDYASLTSAISVTDFTYETWVYHTPTGGGNDYGYFFSGQSKGLAISEGGTVAGLTLGDLYYYNGSIVGLGYSLPANQWVHLVAVCDGTSNSIETYTNGSLVSTTSVSNIQTSITELSRYDGGGGSNYLNGKISGVRVYNDKLTAAEVLQNYNATEKYYPKSIVTNGLILNLDAGDFDSYNYTGGTTWTDLSGQGNDGTLVNGTTFSSPLPRNFVFDGTNDYVDCGNSSVFNQSGGKSFTVTCWALFNTATQAFNPIFNKAANNGTFEYALGLNSSRGVSWLTSSNGTNWIGTGVNETISLNEWYYYAVGFDYANQVSFASINGKQIYTSAQTGIYNGSRPFEIGRHNDPVTVMDGRVSNLSFYDRVLTAAEVEYNFNVLKGRYA